MAGLDNRLSCSCTCTTTQIATDGHGMHERGCAQLFKSCLCMVSIRRVNHPSFNFFPVNAVIVSQMKATILRFSETEPHKKQMLRDGLSRK